MKAKASTPRPLRIVQTVEKLEIGGLERFAVDLAIAEKHAGHEPSVVCFFQAGKLAPEAQAAGVPVVALERPSGFSWASVQALADEYRKASADVVHTHNAVIHHYGVLAARLAGVPVVVNTRHGTGVIHSGRRQDWYFRGALPLTGAVVCVCEDGRQFFTTHRGVPRSKARVILNGIPLGRFLENPASPGSAAPRIRIGTVGRLVEAKAHDVLINAFALLKKRLPQAELRIVGGGPLEAKMEERIRAHGLEADISLEGATSDTPAVYSALDIFVLSSISEGLPIVILEAMASGLPIVSTRIGGVPEVAPEGEVAWFAKPGDAQSLAEALWDAATSPNLAEKGALARQIAASQYSIDQTQENYVELFRSLLRRKGRS